MVVPEKASSYNIHPERCCSDVCHYCGMKFGILDTPLHVSQLKTAEVQRYACEFASVSVDACLCDKCFRYIDRAAKSKKKERAAAAIRISLGGAAAGAGGRGSRVDAGVPGEDSTKAMAITAGGPGGSAGGLSAEDKARTCVVRSCNREVGR